jgi:hypothetical protein
MKFMVCHIPFGEDIVIVDPTTEPAIPTRAIDWTATASGWVSVSESFEQMLLDVSVVHFQPSSTFQRELHPSPSKVFPSSHISPPFST